MTYRTFVLGVLIACAPMGCAAMRDILTRAAQVGQVVGTAIDVAEKGAAVYYARHPRPDDERKVSDSLQVARDALLAFDRAVVAGKNIDKARGDAIKAYESLRQLLDDLGILDARIPEGGAETEAPEPKVFDLPTIEELQ